MTVVDLYTIQIISDEELLTTHDYPFLATLKKTMEETEENLTDLFPGRYRARIRRWDDNSDEPTQEDNDE